MKRDVARLAFTGSIALVVSAICVITGHWLPEYWGVALAAGFSSLTWGPTRKWFDRHWPKPKQGWAE